MSKNNESYSELIGKTYSDAINYAKKNNLHLEIVIMNGVKIEKNPEDGEVFRFDSLYIEIENDVITHAY
jgi:sRNA-binding regulator protein Hfq